MPYKKGNWAQLDAARSVAIAQMPGAQDALEQARAEQMAYADAVQRFAIDATKSVARLGELRAETVRYYEAQKVLADMMKTSAQGLRDTVLGLRRGDMATEDRFAAMQAEYSAVYASAMGADGQSLAGYADELDEMLGPLVEAARSSFASEDQYRAFLATTLARADAVAGRP